MNSVDKNIYGEELINQAEQFIQNCNGSAIAALKESRTASVDFLKQNGFPGPKAEEYKFTRLTKSILGKFDFTQSEKISTVPTELIQELKQKHQGANVLFFLNGVYSPEHAEIVSPNDQIIIQSLSERADADQLIAENEDAFQAQNNIHSNSGVVVEVFKNKQVSQPVISYYLSLDAGSNHGFVKNIFLINEGSESSFVHFHRSVDGAKTFTNESKKYLVKQNANVNVYQLQEESSQAIYVGNTNVYQERDSVFSAYTFTFDGELVRNNLTIRVDGEGCESNMYGLYLVNGNTHVDNHTAVDHMQPNCNSNELYKGIIDDKARGVFNGKIFVRQAAQKTNAFQSNGNILLKDTAIINTKPQLEIWADDVKCSHGCTTGQLNEEAIFYLRARGIEKEKAKSMILLAYASEVIEYVKLDWIKEIIAEKVSKQLSIEN